MTLLITTPNFEAGDDFYEALIDAHRELSTAQSHELNAKLVLLLANHIGRQAVLCEALNAARANVLSAPMPEPLVGGSAFRRDGAVARPHRG